MCHRVSGPGNGRTNTSERPDSFDVYASHRPSGENTAPGRWSMLLNMRCGVCAFQPEPLTSTGRIMRSHPSRGICCSNARYLPLGCHDVAICLYALSIRRWGSPGRSTESQYKLESCFALGVEEKTIVRL